MKEDFVLFELAKKLEEKGFDEECFAHYDDLGNLLLDKDYWKLDSHILAPTISQVLKWLRDEKKIYVYPNYLPSSDKWICLIYDINEPRMYSVIDCISFEEANLSGVEYVIDNLI